MPSSTDLLRDLDTLLVAYARERLKDILDGQAPPLPKLTPAKPSARPLRRAKTAKAKTRVLIPCPAKLANGKRCGALGAPNPRFQFHCEAHLKHAEKRRKADWTSFKEERDAKPGRPKVATKAAKPAPKRRAVAKRPTPPSKAPKKPAMSAKSSAATKAINEAKRIAGTKPVACPVAGCKNSGIRRFSNFCAVHEESLGKAEKKKLRAAQVAKTPAAPASSGPAAAAPPQPGLFAVGEEIYVRGASAIWHVKSQKMKITRPVRCASLPAEAEPLAALPPGVRIPTFVWA